MNTGRFDGHTPGPWYVDDAPDVEHPSVVLADDGATIVAEATTVVAEQHDAEANARLIAAAPDLLAEVKRLRKVILDFSLPMWTYLNPQVHRDEGGLTEYAVKSLVRNTPYESLMHLWEDACDYLPDPDCEDVPSNRTVWSERSVPTIWRFRKGPAREVSE